MTVKCLVIGNGPSKKDYEFIKNFEGIILCVDVTAREIIDIGVIPDYQLFSETHETIWKYVLEWLPDNFLDTKIRKNMTVVHRSNVVPGMYNRIGRVKLKSIVFDTDRYGNENAINNVGLYSVVFADEYLKADECYLIGLDYGGWDDLLNRDYPKELVQNMINSAKHYLNNKTSDMKIIDHSKGNFPIVS